MAVSKTPTSKTGRSTSGSPGPMSVEMRRRKIAETAYFLAAQRGFQAGNTIGNRLIAENKINNKLARKR